MNILDLPLIISDAENTIENNLEEDLLPTKNDCINKELHSLVSSESDILQSQKNKVRKNKFTNNVQHCLLAFIGTLRANLGTCV